MSIIRYLIKTITASGYLFSSTLKSVGFYCTLATMSLLPVVYADDTEIFFSEASDEPESYPNILFILDNSGSMRGTKLADMKTAMNSIIDSVSDVNIGLMNFTIPQHGGRLVYPVTDLEAPGVSDSMRSVINAMEADTWTPIVRAYYEAAMVMRGGAVEFGRGRYDSPMVSECQNNYIVILSDGAATTGQSTNSIKDLIGLPQRRRCENRDLDEACGVELARWLKTNKRTSTSDPLIDKEIITYTIGFNINSSFLSDLATEGGGAYFRADTANELTAVFEDIISAVSDVDTTFVAPATSINQFNRLTLGNDLYFSLFQPQPSTTWIGNLKRYQLGVSGGSIKILDKNMHEAIDVDTGFFKNTAQSIWSDSVDGAEVAEGGVAAKLPLQDLDGSNRRKVFTYLDDVNVNGPVVLQRRDSDYLYELHPGNDGITDSNVPPLDDFNATRDNIVRWARGHDVKNENPSSNRSGVRAHIGDPLHSSPTVVQYPTRSVVYFGTNEGFLHAIDSNDGSEIFSFIPKELLGNLSTLYANEKTVQHTYGLDGHITVWHDDKEPNIDGIVNGADKVYLYVGMRRGGRNYYTFDVTDPENPKFIWQIEGGSAEFPQLGQTWSKPLKTRVMYKSELRDVLVFGGGYNPNQDQDQGVVRRNDSYGNSVYMVDAETGEKIWNAKAVSKWSDMTFSIPSDILVLDTDGSGLTDRMYVGDMGGQVWRFDIKPNHGSSDSAESFVNGGVMADLGGNGSTNSIRFFNQPDVALINQQGQRFLSISIGSGWRAHPLDEQTNDRFYMIRDNSPLFATGNYGRLDGSTYRAINDSDLVNVTTNGEQSLSSIPHGWYLQMEDPGEKVLGKSITINNQVIFSSYTPGVTRNACEPAIGTSTAYVVKITNGDPILVNGSAQSDPLATTAFDKENRKKRLQFSGIAPSPSAVISEVGGDVLTMVLFGTEELAGIDFSQLTHRTYWLDKHRGPQTPAEIATK